MVRWRYQLLDHLTSHNQLVHHFLLCTLLCNDSECRYVCFDHGRLDSWIKQLLTCYRQKSWLALLAANPTPSTNSLAKLIGWQTHDVAVMYSASEVESMIIDCFFDIPVKVLSHVKNTNYVVLFRSSVSPPQSLSFYPTSL